MVPYYLLKSADFNPKKIKILNSEAQTGIENILDDAPLSAIEKSSSQCIKNFICYNLKTEILKRQKGRAFGCNDIFENFILIKDDTMYFYKNENLLILCTSKENFIKFTKRFETNEYFTFDTLHIDFSTIIDNAHNLGTDSVWLGNLDNAHLHSVGLMGYKVQNSDEYREHIANGASVTNISFIYNFKGQQERIMISKDGGIILYSSKLAKNALELVIDVYKKMLL